MKMLFLVFLLFNTCYAQQIITTHDELNEITDLSRLPLYRNSTSLQQESSYDREGKNDDGFSGKYSFVRRNADSTLVMFEAKGPGVINRIWTPTPTDDTLDLYIDGLVFSIKYADLFSGKVKPFTAPLCGNALGGYYCYYPILFADSCKIVTRGKKLQFHQVQWRAYAAGTTVKNDFNAFGFAPQRIKSFPFKGTSIRANGFATIFQQSSGGRINSFRIFPASAFEGKEKDVWIKITYDKDTHAAVYCPLADFFGFAFGKRSMKSWLLGVENDTAYCNMPMPFDSKCKIEIENKGSGNVAVTYSFDYSSFKRNPKSEGKLYTSYSHHRYKKNDGPHVLLKTSGKGHLIGTILQCQGTDPGMTLFFEGDDSTVVDGTNTLHGTGSEDYFNGGWYAFPDRWDAAYSLPFHGSLEYNLPYCRTGAYRFYLADKVPFGKSFYHSIEHGPIDNNIPAIYTSLTFYYGTQPPDKLNVSSNIRVYMPDTLIIYPQLTNVNLWNSVGVKSLWAHDTGGLSYVYSVNSATSIRYSLENIEDGKYDLYIDYDKLPDGAEVRVLQQQTLVRDFFSSYSKDSVRVRMEKVGQLEKNGFSRSFSLEFLTVEGRDQFFLNRFMLVRK